MSYLYLFVILSVGFNSWAQEKAPWSHESEAAIVKVGGNTESESYSAKQKTSLTRDKNLWVATGRYLLI